MIKFLTWTNLVDGYREWSGCIIDKDNTLLVFIDRIFGTNGEYTPETVELMDKHKVDKSHIVSYQYPAEEAYQIYCNDAPPCTDFITPEMAIKYHVMEMEQSARISNFLTPEKQAELMALFSKKK